MRVLNFFRANETVYMVMRYERGRTLQQQIQMRQDQMSERLVRHVFMQLLNGLREVHTHKLLHLDIKPANIYLRTDGSPVLLDFGAARQTLTTNRPKLAPMYTPGFAAPEQYRDPDRLGPWTDVYGVGASMFACLAAFAPQAADARVQEDHLVSAKKIWSGQYSDRRARGDRLVPAPRPARAAAVGVRAAEGDSRDTAEEAQAHLLRQPQAQAVHRNRRLTRAGRRFMRFTIFQESRRGSRKVNQDRIAYTYGRDTLLLVVCDGMGGHAGGEIAAQISVRLFIERFQREAKPILKNPFKFLQDSMIRAHAALGSYANQFSMLETPRTTCVACVVQAGHAYWAHVGDSRLYLYREGGLIGQTKDHSKVQYLVDQGIIGAGESPHPDRNKIFSCLGGLVDPVIDLGKRTPLRDGDILMLCTDGVWGVLTKDEIATWLTSTPILKSAPQMVREAEHRGGDEGDNLSTIVVRWGPDSMTDVPSTTITETMGLGEFQTQIDRTLTLTDRKGTQRDLSDDEIERAIAEIQATIQRYRK